ncbi:MAG TPA: antibiotic biosynthesis monooxygenase [candidate division Zixibacteria bacterium]|nr:antibiotic biosynthesis monooxygenase [candidate division Zixibacteria bacterium]
MPYLVIKHKVKDFDNWKTQFDNFADFRKSSGEKSYSIMHPADDPNDLVGIFEWDSIENAQKFVKAPELKEAMSKAGVISEPEIEFMKESTSGSL